MVLLAIFFAVPAIIYSQFQDADKEKNALLIDSVQTQGKLIAQSLAPQVEKIDGPALRTIAQTVQNFGTAGPNIKLLYRPANQSKTESFFYVASSPAVSPQYLEQERQDLLQSGVLDRLGSSCADERSEISRFVNPAGGQELLTSITPIRAASGCWAVITATHASAYLGSSLGRPYWQTPAVRLAAAIYLAMALIVTVMFVQAGLNLRRFGRLARNLRTGEEQRGSFTSLNHIPELSWVAEEFDNLVETMRSSAQALRFAAEEVAHAFKTPIAIIAQSLEPLRRSVPKDDARAGRAIELMDRSLERLDGLVSAARRLDETIADSFNPPRDHIVISDMVSEIASEYDEAHDPAHLRFIISIDPGLAIMGSVGLLETLIQNLIDNAISFSRDGGTVEVRLRGIGDVIELAILDQGPGVEPNKIGHIFERLVSDRPAETGKHHGGTPGGNEHFGLGLWIVRRNVEAMGGVVAASNRSEGGLCVVAAFPRIR